MATSRIAFALIVAVATAIVAPAHAADDAALLKDLTSVIALLGLPCGDVVSAQRQADNDHVVACKAGARYRVYINPEGRVVAQKL